MKIKWHEQVKDIPGYEGLYAITSLGRVWSYPKKKGTNRDGQWMSVNYMGSPSPYVALSKKGYGRRVRSINKLVRDIFGAKGVNQ